MEPSGLLDLVGEGWEAEQWAEHEVSGHRSKVEEASWAKWILGAHLEPLTGVDGWARMDEQRSLGIGEPKLRMDYLIKEKGLV
jgi:hypothetical protein